MLTGIYQVEGAGRTQIIAVEALRDLNHACILAAEMEAWPGAESATQGRRRKTPRPWPVSRK